MWVQNGRLYDRYIGRDGKPHRISVPLAKDTPQARRKAEKELNDKITSILSFKSQKCLNELVVSYLDQKDVKPTTLSNESSALKKCVEILEDVPVSSLTVPGIKRSFMESGRPASKLNRYILIFNCFLKWCYEFGYTDICLKVSAFPVKANNKDKKLYLEAEELRSVLDALEGTMEGYLCRFLALSGLRIGEALALKLSDLDDYIHVTKTFTHLMTVQTPKTDTSKRDVFIQPELKAMLREYYQWRQLHLMASGIRTDLLFYNQRGTYYYHHKLSSYLSAIDPELHPHIFRHTHTALLAEQGISLEAISRRLGHSDSKITKEVYFHVTNKIKARDEIALANIKIL